MRTRRAGIFFKKIFEHYHANILIILLKMIKLNYELAEETLVALEFTAIGINGGRTHLSTAVATEVIWRGPAEKWTRHWRRINGESTSICVQVIASRRRRSRPVMTLLRKQPRLGVDFNTSLKIQSPVDLANCDASECRIGLRECVFGRPYCAFPTKDRQLCPWKIFSYKPTWLLRMDPEWWKIQIYSVWKKIID